MLILSYVKVIDMKKEMVLLPQIMENLRIMGEQIKLARLRRDLPATVVAERANITRQTLIKIEKGDPTVAMGNYASVLHGLNNMDKDLLLIAKDDVLGRTIQDLNLTVNKRSVKK